MGDKTICKVSVEAGDLYLFVTAWEDGNAGFDIALTDTENAWSGTVTEDELGYLAKKMKVDFDSYISETRKALSRKNVGNLNFEYSMKEEDDDYVFSWKKYLPNDKIRIQLGHCKITLRDESSDLFKEMLEHSIEAGQKTQENINSLESDNQRLSAERAGALKRLEKAVANKEDMEKDLYSKFVVVVNDKKRKIRELRDELEELRSNGVPSTSKASGDSSKSQTNNASNKKRTNQQEMSSEESENEIEGHGSDYDTEEEKEQVVKSAPSPAKKSKAKVKETLDTSDDLCLDLGDDDNSPVTTTRRRGRKGAVKKTPSKPIIPKVASSEQKSKTPSGRGRPSMKKSDSHTSNISNTSSRKSSDPSADDLLADL